MPRITQDCGCVIGSYDSDESEAESESKTKSELESDSESESESESESKLTESSDPLVLKIRKGITVNNLIKYLQDIKETNKEFGTYILHHVEFGSLTQTLNVIVDTKGKMIVAMSYG